MSFTRPGVPTPSDAVLPAVLPSNEGQEHFARMSESVRTLVPEGCTKDDYGWFVLPVNPEKLQAAKIPSEIIAGLQADGEERKVSAAFVGPGATEDLLTLRLDADGGTSIRFVVRSPEYIAKMKEWNEKETGMTVIIELAGFSKDGVSENPEAFIEEGEHLQALTTDETESLLKLTITAVKSSFSEPETVA